MIVGMSVLSSWLLLLGVFAVGPFVVAFVAHELRTLRPRRLDAGDRLRSPRHPAAPYDHDSPALHLVDDTDVEPEPWPSATREGTRR